MSCINYNPKAQILSIKISHKKSVDSDVENNVVVDYDETGRITNIDLMKVSINEFERARHYYEDLVPARKSRTLAMKKI